MNRIVFLDIDGVLAPHGRPNPDVWCHETVMLVKRLVDETGAKVVLVSSWPEYAACEQLAAHGIKLFDALDEPFRMGYAGYGGRPGREVGMLEYIEQHKPEAWVWIDDWLELKGDVLPGQDDVPWDKRKRTPHPLASGYIQTTWTYDEDKAIGHGFDEYCFDRAKAILLGIVQRTKNFTWSDGPDPTTWTWEWCGRGRGYLMIYASANEPIAQVVGSNWVRVFADNKSPGYRESWKHENECTHEPRHFGGTLMEGECASWRDGVRIVEEWLRDVPVWGTSDDVRWTGWLGRLP